MTASPVLHATIANVCKLVSAESRRCAAVADTIPKLCCGLGHGVCQAKSQYKQNPSCFAQFMALISVDVWCVPNIILLGKAKHELAHSVIPAWET